MALNADLFTAVDTNAHVKINVRNYKDQWEDSSNVKIIKVPRNFDSKIEGQGRAEHLKRKQRKA